MCEVTGSLTDIMGDALTTAIQVQLNIVVGATVDDIVAGAAQYVYVKAGDFTINLTPNLLIAPDSYYKFMINGEEHKKIVPEETTVDFLDLEDYVGEQNV